MAKSFHELSPRAQTIVFVMLSLLTAGATWTILLSPQRTAMAGLREQLQTLEAELVRAQGVAARLPAAEREVKALEASLRETQSVIPEEKDPQDVLRNLHQLASESLLDIASFKPKNVVTKTQYTEWPIELGLEGSYHDLGRFFDRIASMPRLMSVSDLSIKTKLRPNGRGSVSVSCVATTFVFEKEMEVAHAGGQR
jgi:type IV pilus assembly protein PilO